jgi:hypothetical protein
MSAVDLLADTLTFLAFLHAHDIRPRGPCWLPPAALRGLNTQLILSDVVAPPSQGRGGKRGTIERDTERIRFIHFLCEAAHLVAKTGPYLKPTLRVARWLAADSLTQLRTLFDAAYPLPPTRPHDELWHADAYRLPGHTLTSPTVSLAPLFDILRQMQGDERLKLTTLLKLVPLPDDDRESPEQILRGVLNQLDWFGAIVWRGVSIVQLTDLGLALLNRSDALPSHFEGEGPGVRVDSPSPVEIPSSAGEGPGMGVALPSPVEIPSSTGEGLGMGVEATFAQLYELSDYAELISVKPIRRYRLDRDRIQRALQRGLTLDGLLRFFEALIGDALPEWLHRQLRDWAAQLDQIAIRRVTILEVRDPATLTELTRAHRLRESLGRTLSPRAVIIRPARLAPLVRQIKQRGLVPRLYFSDPRLRDHSTTRLYDDPPRAQLYYAALLNHYQADRLPTPYRVDYSIVLDLEHQLSLHDRQLAQELAAEAADKLTADQRALFANRLRDAPSTPAADHPPTAVVIKTIEQAIATNTPLALTYYAASFDQTTQRLVDPLRLEWHGDVPYLIAYCHLRQDERTFRVDRILDIRE